MNKAYDAGVKICTSFRDSKNFSDSWVSANSAMMFYMECCMVHHTRTICDVGTYVSGTGYYVDSNIIKENGGWIHHLLVEDIELTIDELRKMTDTKDKYPNFKHLQQKVLDIAVHEIVILYCLIR